jgi:rhodanese-related sulfurtransferase
MSETTGVLTPQEYQQTYGEGGQGHFLLDVRLADEFAGGHISGATNIAVQELADHLSEVPRDLPVVVYCRSGGRSAKAAALLREAGYTQVHDLGGVIGWQQAGYPLVPGNQG